MTGRSKVIAAVVLALVLAGSAVNVGRLWLQDRRADDRQAALGAARTMVPQLLTYDYRTLDRDLARAQGNLTGDFAREYATVSDQTLRKDAVKNEQSMSTQVASAGIVSATEDSATVMLFLNQIASSAKDKNVVTASRLQVVMRQTGAGWRVSDLRAV